MGKNLVSAVFSLILLLLFYPVNFKAFPLNSASINPFTKTSSDILQKFNHFADSLNVKDSLYIGRRCTLMLEDGTEETARITNITADSVTFTIRTKAFTLPIKGIKLISLSGSDLIVVEIPYENEQAEFFQRYTDASSKKCILYLVTGDTLPDVQLSKYSDSTILVFNEESYTEVKYNDIKKIIIRPNGIFWKGYLIGSVVGFLAAGIPVGFNRPDGHPSFGGVGAGIFVGLLASVPTGLIFGLAAVIVITNDNYNIAKLPIEKKIRYVNKIIKKYPN